MLFEFIGYVYKEIPGNLGCCIENRNFHRSCTCQNVDLKICPKLCDEDLGCKGYTTIHSHCQLATVSNCTYESVGCDNPVKNNDHFGNLLENGTCGNDESYSGCYVKRKNNFIHFYVILINACFLLTHII